jgi:UDP-N-acetylglucosamine 2-epimerase (non-hydrolysing)
MKIKPVMAALERRGAETVLVHTGQHYDPELSDRFFEDLGIRAPDHFLGAGSGTHAAQTAAVMLALEPLMEEIDPVTTCVVGDVNSTVAAALVAAKAGSLVAHVEAGLRSRDWAMPEEINRVVTDRVSDFLLAPSEDACENLRNEGYRSDQIHLVGNVMVDTLLDNVERARALPVLEDLGLERGKYGVVTLHRPSTVDDPELLQGVLGALDAISRELPLVFPAHPRTHARMASLDPGGVRVIAPMGYLDFLALEAGAALVLTDSGGIQEETTALGVACLTLRENTERPITIAEGTNRLVGRDPEAIVAAARDALASPPEPRSPALWDGKAGERIADVLLADTSARSRPTDVS